MSGAEASRFEDLVGAHALGALDASERRAFERILARRPGLRRKAEELRRTASLLNFAGPAHNPPEGLAEKVLSRVANSENDPTTETGSRGAFTHLRTSVRGCLAGKRKRVVMVTLACAALVLAARPACDDLTRRLAPARGAEREDSVPGPRRAPKGAGKAAGPRWSPHVVRFAAREKHAERDGGATAFALVRLACQRLTTVGRRAAISARLVVLPRRGTLLV